MSNVDIQMKIDGVEPVIQKLQSLTPDLKRKALRNAVGRGASIIRKSATSRAPEDTGAMSKNIRVQFASRTTRRTGDMTFRVGVRGGAQKPGSKTRFARTKKAKRSAIAEGSSTWYWRLVEFGTQKMRARPFMRLAMASSAESVFRSIGSDLDKAIDKFAKTGKSA